MRPSKGGSGNLMHYFWVYSLFYIVKEFFLCITNFIGLMILFPSSQMTSSWIQALDRA